jgi:hypothetical protein
MTVPWMEVLMIRSSRHVLPIVVLTYLGAGASLAQSQTQPQSAPKPAETSTIKMEDVSKWTQKQWNAAKAKWSEEKTKWNDCQTQAKAKNFQAIKAGSFFMTV